MKLMRTTLPVVALGFSVAALALVLVHGTLPTSPDIQTSALRKAELLEERVRNLEASLVTLTKRQRRVETEAPPAPPVRAFIDQASPASSEAGAEGGSGPSDVTEVAVLLEPVVKELERKQESLEQELVELGVFEHFEKVQQKLTESYAVALNPDLPAKQRLGALPILREAERIDENVVSAMITLWNEDGSPRVGYHVMEHLEGVRDAALRDKILESLQEEEIPKLRERAIQTLAPMMPDPYVEEWLVYLQDNDPEPGVRKQAANAYRRAETAR